MAETISDEVMEMLSRLGEEYNACIPHGPVMISIPTKEECGYIGGPYAAYGGRDLLVMLRNPQRYLPVEPAHDRIASRRINRLRTMPWPAALVDINQKDVEQEPERRRCFMCNGKKHLLDGTRCDSLNCDDGYTAYREQDIFGWWIKCSVLRRIAMLPGAYIGVSVQMIGPKPAVRFFGSWEYGYMWAKTCGEVQNNGPF